MSEDRTLLFGQMVTTEQGKTRLLQENGLVLDRLNHTAAFNRDLQQQLEESRAALARANALVADWQSAMEAWKDLAVTLREEIKSCPNHDAHKFGRDKDQVNMHLQSKEEAERRKRGLKPKYRPE